MGRRNMRAAFRWMPLWLLRIVFAVCLIVFVLPAVIWDAVRDVVRTIKQDWRDLHRALEDDE
jgi:hypothetical protein